MRYPDRPHAFWAGRKRCRPCLESFQKRHCLSNYDSENVMGYTPVFDSVFHGTLCGKWPTLPVWLTILPMADKNGHIDMTFQAMAALTGWPIDLLKQAIAELSSPDPDSRSEANEGRRLLPLDPGRSWGWMVVNHGAYREKARLTAKSAREVESGKNKDRMNDRRPPPPTASDPLSYSNAYSDLKPRESARAPEIENVLRGADPELEQSLVPEADREASRQWVAYLADLGKPAKPSQYVAIGKTLAALGDAETQRRVVGLAMANGWRSLRMADAAHVLEKSGAAILTWRPDPKDDLPMQAAS